MNIDNRRLREIQRQIKAYNTLIDCSDSSIEERIIYQGKLDSLEREEKEILAMMEKKTQTSPPQEGQKLAMRM